MTGVQTCALPISENDKPTVIALREIEEGFIDASILLEKDTLPQPKPERVYENDI